MRAIPLLILTVILTLLLRSTALTSIAARGVVIDVLAAATVLWALRNGETWGATFGFVLGLLADLDAAHWMGRHALVLSLTGYAVGRLSHTLVRNSVRTQAALLLTAAAVHQSWVGAFELSGLVGWPYLLQRVLISAVATAGLGIVLLFLSRSVLGRVMSHGSIESGSAS